MDKKIMLLTIIVVCLCILCATVILNKTNNNANTTNITNNTTNMTNNTINVTHIGKTNESTVNSNSGNSNSGNSNSGSKSSSNLEYGSDAYVEKWDSSQQQGDSWAYTHDQPVKYENGHQYSRVYNPDSGESYWNQIN